MKTVMTFMLSGALLIAAASLGEGQPKVEKGRATSAASEHPPTKQICGKVTEVDDKAGTFTISAKGKVATFDAGPAKSLPKVGDTVDVTYSTTGEPPKGATLRGNTIKVVWQEGKK